MNGTLMDHATETMAAGSKSFNTAAKLFDASTRRSALMLYARCRYCDDVIDGQALGFRDASALSGSATQRLAMLKTQTQRAFAGAEMQEPAFAAFQEVATRHAIPPQQAFDHLEGFAMDVRDTHYETFEDTLRYCYHVAGVVGLMMARVMGVRNEAVLDRACDLGLAFQLTNIARDIVEDAETGRCYLPAQWLAEEGSAGSRSPIRLTVRSWRVWLSGWWRPPSLTTTPRASGWLACRCVPHGDRVGARGLSGDRGEGQRRRASRTDRRQGTSRAEKIALLMKGAALAISSRVASTPPRSSDLWQRPHRHGGHAE